MHYKLLNYFDFNKRTQMLIKNTREETNAPTTMICLL